MLPRSELNGVEPRLEMRQALRETSATLSTLPKPGVGPSRLSCQRPKSANRMRHDQFCIAVAELQQPKTDFVVRCSDYTRGEGRGMKRILLPRGTSCARREALPWRQTGRS